VWLCLGTLTALPVPAPAAIDRRTRGTAMLLAPVAGAGVGATAAAVAWAAGRAGLAGLPAAVLAVVTLQLATRAFHLDGLADTADGLASGYDRERALAVMRRGDVGPAGVAAVVLVVLAQVGGLAQALAGLGPVAVLIAAVVARACLPAACVRGVPAARTDGLGAATAGSVPTGAGVAVVVAAGVAAAALAAAGGLAWWRGALALLVAVAVAAALVVRSVRRLGGITGDVLGACVEAATAAALLALAPR
jgi:adenosylcobinamide-GDP ribazoletransferase